MEPSFAVLIVTASILGGVVMDVGVNTLQNWYDTFYQDSFWSGRRNSPELEAQLAREEAEVSRLINERDFAADINGQP
ncbi:hypothetical protein [Azospirillum sp. sgz301742]